METNTIKKLPPCPKTWMIESILVTIFCCLPFGIVAIIKASKVTSQYVAENYVESQKASAQAGKWVKLSIGGGIVCWLIMLSLNSI